MYLLDDEPPVLRVRASAEMALEFEKDHPYGPEDPYVTGMLVRARGDRVRIEQRVALAGSVELPAFLIGLYDDFRGWPGERTWRSLNRELCVAASHDGYVQLRWTVANRSYGGSSWAFTTSTGHQAGEDMRHLADAFDVLLNGRG